MRNTAFALAAAALVLGLLGLFAGLTARREVQAIQDQSAAIESRLAEASEPAQRALRDVRQLNEYSRDAFRRMQAEVAALRQEIETLSRPEPTPAREPPSPEKRATERVPSGRTHRVAEGDTLSRIARQYGVPLQDLLDANPGIDPRRIRIGQDVHLP